MAISGQILALMAHLMPCLSQNSTGNWCVGIVYPTNYLNILWGSHFLPPAPVPRLVKPSETPAANRVDQGYDNVKCIVGQCYKASLWNCWRELSQLGKEESARQFLVLPTRGSLLSFALKFVAKPGVFTSPPECTMEGAQIQYFLPLKGWWAPLWQVERVSIFLGKFTSERELQSLTLSHISTKNCQSCSM